MSMADENDTGQVCGLRQPALDHLSVDSDSRAPAQQPAELRAHQAEPGIAEEGRCQQNVSAMLDQQAGRAEVRYAYYAIRIGALVCVTTDCSG